MAQQSNVTTEDSAQTAYPTVPELARASPYMYLILNVGWRDPLALYMAVLAIKLFIIDMIIIPIWELHWNRNQTSTFSFAWLPVTAVSAEKEDKPNTVVFFPIKCIFTVILSYSESEFALCNEEHDVMFPREA